MSERKKLLKQIQECDFVLYETALFLDTHPSNRAALQNYRKHQLKRRDLVETFTKKFGMLEHDDFGGGISWSWVDSPWPWESEKEA
ncbi:MAG: spore coat protein CotJB [Oscillospiraceae bacterium]|jgi:spore coat protein JB|nr:spore coat protein CotJB [Oscillospiraceae bacterium]